MRKYDAHDERVIRMQMLVREWTRSGLFEQAQQEHVLPELKVTLRRTNPFLRLILFAFGFLIIVSAVAFVGITAQIHDELATATLCIVAAAASYIVAELLISGYQLYRFGIEEAAAVASVPLAALGIGIYASRLNFGA